MQKVRLYTVGRAQPLIEVGVLDAPVGAKDIWAPLHGDEDVPQLLIAHLEKTSFDEVKFSLRELRTSDEEVVPTDMPFYVHDIESRMP